MAWWNSVTDWFNSTIGWRIFSTAILPFIAIIVAALIGTWIGRVSIRRVLEHQDRELKAAAIMALIGAGRKAAIWSSLGLDEKQHVDSLISEADMRVRLLPVNGASSAADWAAHELAAMKKNSATFSFQAEQTFLDYRDRLLEWQDKPRRARKLFAFDLVHWQYDDNPSGGASTEPPQWAANTLDAPAPVTAPVTVTTTSFADAGTRPTSSPNTGPIVGRVVDADGDVVDEKAGTYPSPVVAGAVRRATGTPNERPLN